jgi:small subunit ribosomal protein S20
MAITKGAKKAHRASLKKRVFNLRRKNAMKDATKAVTKSMTAKGKDTEKLLSEAFSAIDKAAKRGVIKANAAARKKSRLVAAMKKAQA